MITLIVATHNRAYTLARVAKSFFEQEDVKQIVFVLDGCTDDTAKILNDMGQSHPSIDLQIIEQPKRLGQSISRNNGVKAAKYDYILFCDDDEYMEKGYARICYQKHKDLQNAGVVSGRRIYLLPEETQQDALDRFKNGNLPVKPYLESICEYVNAARFDGDLEIPIVNAIMMTRKDLLLKFPFDPFYSNGNGYREESDFQMNLYTNGFKNYVTNECHTFHLPLSQVRLGGQRAPLIKRLVSSTVNTNYFYKKYYDSYSKLRGIKTPKTLALCLFVAFYFYRETIRSFLRSTYRHMKDYLFYRV